MRFKQFLMENKEKHSVLAFGRLQPPTVGHEKLIDKVKEVAKAHNASHHVVLSHSQDSKKNPLSPEQKLKHAKRAFPGTNLSVSNKEHPTFLDQAAKLHKQGVTHLHMVGGSDRVEEYHKKLHQYNGTHEGALYNFKKITVHSAGERDPSAGGTKGMSASKMRDHAASGNFHEFRKGIPKHVPEHHAKELYNDVRSGMHIKEEYLTLKEGVHDHAAMKAVFIVGGPGSGKDWVLKNTLEGHGLQEINSDKAFEHLMDKKGLSKKMPESEEEQRNLIRSKAKNMTELRQYLALQGRNGLAINGTGHDHEKIGQMKKRLEELGYDTHMIMVHTDDETSKKRNIARGEAGGRTVPEKARSDRWSAVQAARPKYAEMFKKRYTEFDNSADLNSSTPDVVKAKKQELMSIHKSVGDFIAEPPKSEPAQKWIASELERRDKSDPEKLKQSELPPHSKAGGHGKAQEMGLQYYGHGRYGQKGKVTHRISPGGQLIDMEKFRSQQEKQKEKDKKSKLNEAVSLTITGDSPQEVNSLFFTLQNSVKNVNVGESSNYMSDDQTKNLLLGKKIGITGNKIDEFTFENEDVINKEENKNVKVNGLIKEDVWPEKGRTNGDSSSSYSSRTNSRSSASTRSEQTGFEGKITLAEIRRRQKEKYQESIDKGIEPGLSMAASGENMGRNVDKTKKPLRKPLETALKELTGDESTINSIGAEKELELKRKGISLKSFKAKRPIG